MMTLKQLIRENSANKGESAMWETVDLISSYLDERKEDLDEYDSLLRNVYAVMCGHHYNAELAEEQIEQMYYEDARGQAHYAPYWTDDEMSIAYSQLRQLLPSECNEWDFRVALNMIMSDYHNLLESWFPDDPKSKAIEMTVSYLNDPDSPDGCCKVWKYFNR